MSEDEARGDGGELKSAVMWPESVVRYPAKYQTKFKVVDAMMYDGRNIQDIWNWVGAGAVYGPTESDVNAYVFIRGAKEVLQPGFWLVREEDGGALRPCDPFNFYQLLEDHVRTVRDADSSIVKWVSQRLWDLDPESQLLVLRLISKLLELEKRIEHE